MWRLTLTCRRWRSRLGPVPTPTPLVHDESSPGADNDAYDDTRMRSVMADGLGAVTFLANSTGPPLDVILVVVERGYVVAALEGHPFDRA